TLVSCFTHTINAACCVAWRENGNQGEQGMIRKIFNFTVDKENLSIKIERNFDAPVEMVWSAWTDAAILDQWWGPKPYHVETKSLDFSEGGQWLYAMVGPEGQRHWALRNYLKIAPPNRLTFRSMFCDENGNVAPGATGSTWVNTFTER